MARIKRTNNKKQCNPNSECSGKTAAKIIVITMALMLLNMCRYLSILDKTNNQNSTRDSRHISTNTKTDNSSMPKINAPVLNKNKHLFVTIVMPSVVNPDGRIKRLKAISKTWGPAARAIFVVHDASELPDFPIIKKESNVDIDTSFESFPMLLQIPRTITEEDGVDRLKFVIQEISNLAQPDFSFFVNDHTYVIPEKLCHFLIDRKPNEHLYAGHALKNEKEQYSFNTGAAGYILSRSTSESLIDRWLEKDPSCDAPPGEKWFQSNPGLITAKCLHEALSVYPIDTRCSDNSHIFHAFGIVRLVTGNVDQWYINKHRGFENLQNSNQFGSDYNIVLSGKKCCSVDTISFHYVESYETLALFDVRNHIQENTGHSDDHLKEYIQSVWPDNKEKGWVGGYGRQLPKDDDLETWNDLLETFHKISDSYSKCDQDHVRL